MCSRYSASHVDEGSKRDTYMYREQNRAIIDDTDDAKNEEKGPDKLNSIFSHKRKNKEIEIDYASLLIILSMRPYLSACLASMKLSRSQSCRTFSIGWPVCFASMV